jgi:hypothetical protein
MGLNAQLEELLERAACLPRAASAASVPAISDFSHIVSLRF